MRTIRSIPSIAAHGQMRRTLGITIGVVTVLLAMASTTGAATAQPAQTTTLQDVGAAPAVPTGATELGAVPTSTSVSATVTLRPRHAAALEAMAQAVSTPGRPTYRHFLAPGAFAATFGPTNHQIESVESALRDKGLKANAVGSNHLAIAVSGTSAQMADAFHTSFDKFRLPGGRVVFADTRAPKLGAATASIVDGVTGLDDIAPPQSASVTSPSGDALAQTEGAVSGTGLAGPQPCAALPAHGPRVVGGAVQFVDGYSAGQLASAYGFSSLYAGGDLGAGQTIGVVELAPTVASDISTY
jgi:subtilase family serine protease